MSAMTGSPAIGPTLIGEPEAILKTGCFDSLGSGPLIARTAADANNGRIIETMLSRFMVHLSAKGFINLIRLDGECIHFLPFIVRERGIADCGLRIADL